MLVDVKFRHPDPQMAFVISVMSGGGAILPERIGEGMYQCGHWAIDQLGVKFRERWRETPYKTADYPEYGVCDTPEQAVAKLKLRDRPEKLIITFVRLRRADQPMEGGWRWRKWGNYIGDRKPTCEYLRDEPDIEEVYTFHVYELKPE